MAPGIDFLPASGHDLNLIPHAWIAKPQTTLLRNQLGLSNGDTASWSTTYALVMEA